MRSLRREGEQEGHDALGGAALAGGKQKVARGRQLACQRLVELEAEPRVLSRDLIEREDRQAAQAGRLDGLRVHDMLALSAEADQIARIGEAHHLPPPVAQHLVERHRAGLDLEDVGDGIALGEHKLLGLHPPQRGLGEALLEARRLPAVSGRGNDGRKGEAVVVHAGRRGHGLLLGIGAINLETQENHPRVAAIERPCNEL